MKRKFNHQAMKANARRTAKINNLRDLEKFDTLVSELSSRLEAIAHHQARKPDQTPKQEAERRNALRRGLLARAEKALGVDRGGDVLEPGKVEPTSRSRWRKFVLQKQHVSKWGERKCDVCGCDTLEFDVLWYRPSEPGKVVHDRCKPASATSWHTFELAERHVAKHGPRECPGCGLPVKIGQRAAWKVGQRDIWHEECKKDV